MSRCFNHLGGPSPTYIPRARPGQERPGMPRSRELIESRYVASWAGRITAPGPRHVVCRPSLWSSIPIKLSTNEVPGPP